MADLAKRMCGPMLLTNSSATLYTVPASTQAILRSIHVSNSHASTAVNLTLNLGSNTTANQLFSTYTIPPTSVLDWSGFIVMNAAEILTGFGSTTNLLVITVNGVEVS